MKTFIASLTFLLFSLAFAHSQEVKDSMVYADLDEFVVNRHFQSQYKREMERVKKIYPMAMKAKAIMDEYDKEVALMDKKKEVRKYSRKMNDYLKEEFTYTIRDLYTSEGRLLMQLIHRETGKTVDQILVQYAGPAQAFIYRNMAKMFNQDLRTKYDAAKQNYYTEIVIGDILSGEVEFNPVMDKLTKEAYKASMAEYRANVKEFKQQKKMKAKIVKKEAKEAKKEEKKSKK